MYKEIMSSRWQYPPVITAESVNKAFQAMDALTSEQLDQSYNRLFQAQSHVLQFLVGLTGNRDGIHEAVWNQARSWIAQFFSPSAADDVVETEPILMTYFINLLQTSQRRNPIHCLRIA
jgi:hypothetical protein